MTKQLSTVTDADGRVTTIVRVDADTVEIHAPPGPGANGESVVTTLDLDANGYLSELTDPRGAKWAFDYAADGLMTKAWDERANEGGVRSGPPSTFTYETFGFDGNHERHYLVQDENALGGSQNLSWPTAPTLTQAPIYKTWCDGSQYIWSWVVTESRATVAWETAQGRTNTVEMVHSRTGPEPTDTSIRTEPSGRVTSSTKGLSSFVHSGTAPGMTWDRELTPDPRFGAESAYPSASSTTVLAAEGRPALTRTVVRGETAILTEPLDPLSLAISTSNVTVNGTRTWNESYLDATKTFTSESPEGRTSSYKVDAVGRVVQINAPGQVPTQLVYDAEGYLLEVKRTKGAETRSTRYTYDDRGYLGSVTADSSATESLQTLLPQNDPMGFPGEVTVPGISTTLQSVDVAGATSGITPPGKPQHGMTYDVLGQLTEYRPPLHDAGAPAGTCPDGAECYSYSLDRQLEDVTLADGTVVDYSYGTATGLLDSVVVPDFGTVNYGYTTAGRLQ
ncbi:MAG: hypothetical protein KC416_08595, partial [Myxococcales bacterium]|nr:hypothetical protein [Myxococcales bacterium]